MTEIGRVLVLVGLILILAGFVCQFCGRVNLPLGHLPGDLTFKTKRLTVNFPLATSLLLSVALSALLYLLGRFRR
jgi:hypothetical protein